MMPGITGHAFNPSTQPAEVGKSLLVGGQPDLQSKFHRVWSIQSELHRETLPYKKQIRQPSFNSSDPWSEVTHSNYVGSIFKINAKAPPSSHN